MSEETVEVVNTYQHSFQRIAPGKSGTVPAWYLDTYTGLKPTGAKPKAAATKAAEPEPELGLAELKEALRTSTDEEWISDHLTDHRKTVASVARERLEELDAERG